ncbi:MAG: cytochrome c maturation protein CcmE [Alphaproteobacteria bacterium]|nr:cytochrome c maturation protein CcmE [Alphaproteobacteria bacterium]MDE2042989.1 cytochrome c maturation protein CcmE [Alphaproteobacteria bacterium]MDE2340044.1 cytochrome c maturation protein CcmE [Alphaproteobacteria bacterium]
MKAKHQRLVLVLLAIVAIGGAALLAMFALKDKAAYFYSPSDIARLKPAIGTPLRLGGLVADHSIKRDADGVTIHFIVTDGIANISVRYTGITPDLFREKAGVVAEGALTAPDQFSANTILAKHDEKYMPPGMAGQKPPMGKLQ